MGPYRLWVLSPRNVTLFTRSFLAGRRTWVGHKTSVQHPRLWGQAGVFGLAHKAQCLYKSVNLITTHYNVVVLHFNSICRPGSAAHGFITLTTGTLITRDLRCNLCASI